ncbi:uncharacterized protein LOC141601513 [Silene latifolia]|uniref:uncharacterized protein LOC141601513 n=1 Tax=Silene latifolia TaxID=37657 RepID=UPI003D78AC6E
MWALSKDFYSVVIKCWSTVVQGTPMFRVVTKLKLLKKELRNLNWEQFSDIENLANVTELALKNIQMKLVQDPLNPDLCHAEKVCAAELVEMIKARTMFLSQKPKAVWIAEGDENSSYFHSMINRRRSQNRVYKVKDMRQQKCSSGGDNKIAFEEFYKSLLGESQPVTHINQTIVRMGPCLTDEHKSSLLALLSDNEIKKAIFDIPGNKAPGPDGFGSQFFKDAWQIVGHEVSSAVRDAFTKGNILN